MKKSLILAAILPMLGLGLTGCKDDTQPRLQPAPEGSFQIYEPALNNYTYYLQPEGTITLTTTGQPNYGVATPTQYEVEISFIEDTEKWIDQNDPSLYQNPDNPKEMTGIPTSYKLQTVNTQSIIAMRAREIAVGMNAMMGVKTEEDAALFDATPRPLFVRVHAYVKDPASKTGILNYSEIYSNVLKLNAVQPYFVVPKPGEIFIIGDYQGWDINGNDKTVALTEEENGIGSEIYTGYVEMTDAQAKTGFRFYKELGDWGDDGNLPSIGANANDGDNASVEMEDGVYEGDCVKGKGNWNIQNYPGGWMKITVNLVEMKVIFQYDESYKPAV
ncbi:MAG: hypothetical protein K2N03_05245 [Muribaculaceae bacterium]|nr:hypothetical protein [Muribaculaceae bacterium]